MQVALYRPGLAPKRPAGHRAQLAPVLYAPAPQDDGLELTLSAGHTYPSPHGPEQVGEVKPGVEPKRPGGQSLQFHAAPVLYCPTEHMSGVALAVPAAHA